MHYSYEYLGPDCKPRMQVYEKFKNGFPYCWEYCIQLYPKVAQTGLDRSQGCQEKHQHTPSNDKVVSDEDMPTSVYLEF